VVQLFQRDRERELSFSGYSPSMGHPKVYVCRKCKRSHCVVDAMEKTEAKLILVGCQKICAGPVVGAEVAGRLEWFSRVDSPKRLAGLRLLVRHKKRLPVKALERRRVTKRSGRRPR
jgi:hypothetical protein